MKILSTIICFLLLSSNIFAKELIVITADWCNPCQRLKTFIKENNETIKYDIDIVDIEQNPEIGKKLKVKLLPTSFIFDDNGKLLTKKEGFEQKSYSLWLKNNQ